MNLGKMMKQAQAMQTQMKTMQDQLALIDIQGAAGGGMVSVTMNGKGEMKSIFIDVSLISVEEKDMLEDMVVAAVNDARQKVEEKVAQETQKIMGGLGLPGGLPF